MHRVLIEVEPPQIGAPLTISGEEAVHALRVKRLDIGDQLIVLNGAGLSAVATIEAIQRGGKRDGPGIQARVIQRDITPPVQPRVEVYSATPKGARLDDMIDGLSQVGAAGWWPLDTQRGVVDPRDSKLTRLERIAREASKQCARAWLLTIGPGTDLSSALAQADRTRIVVADASGAAFSAEPAASTIRLLVGPEGGWTPEELSQARASGATIAAFGVHTMRIETAAVVAAAIVLAQRPLAPSAPQSV